MPTLGFLCLKGLPLFGGEHSAQPEKHAGVGFFELSPGLRHAVDLGENLALIWLICRKQGLHRGFLFPHTGAKVHQAGAVLLKYRLHFLLLV
jgi:hypothetical protein